MSGEIPAITPKKLIQVLERIGFTFFRQKGSHRIFTKEELMVIIPIHNKDLKKGTLHQIIKGTGLSIEEFKKYI